VSLVVLAGLVAGGVWVMANGVGCHASPDEEELIRWVRDRAGPDDVYLLPVRMPAVATGRGVASTTFTPPPRPKPGTNLIPVDLQRFRLSTGAAIYVDFKSVPYRDTEVLEWLRRMRQCEEWYASPDWDRPGVRDGLRAAKITHVVAPRDRPIRAGYLKQLHEDHAYIVYRVEEGSR
jgi:hypothetical protein